MKLCQYFGDFWFLAASVPPQIVERLATKEVREGENVRFQVRVIGNPQPEVTWYREDTPIVSSADFNIQQVLVKQITESFIHIFCNFYTPFSSF